jgi:hypothetical protein
VTLPLFPTPAPAPNRMLHKGLWAGAVGAASLALSLLAPQSAYG